MPAFLKIENIGECPSEGFTVLGVSLADTSNNAGVIGQFGSGNKHSVAVLLRNNLSPIVYSGNLRMTFGTKPQTVKDGIASKDFRRVFVKYSGRRNATEELGFVMDYGHHDWTDVSLALREFVSNAIDRSIREKGDWSGVKIEIVEESQVRAKKGHTRIFVPLSPDVLQFYNDLGKWFLHFSEPESLNKAILPKKNRNLGNRKAAVIYRRGVRVREFEATDTESLFDYNLNNLTIDEARKASDWDVKYHCALALGAADKDALAIFFNALLNSETSYWEYEFDTYSLTNTSNTNWAAAFDAIAGEKAVLTCEGNAEQLRRKGYNPVIARESLVNAAHRNGVRTAATVLSADEFAGREVIEPTDSAKAAVDKAWEVIELAGLTNAKEKPPVKCFTSIMEGCVNLNGYYQNGVVYINRDLAPNGMTEVLPDKLVKVAMEEVAHFVTGATDNSRDFQDFLLELATRLVN